VVDAAFSPDGARIATASKDRTARLWDAAAFKPIDEPMRHEHPVDHVAFNSTGTRIVTNCDEADLLQLWDAATGASVGKAMPHKPNYAWTLVPFSPDGKRIVTVANWSVQLWDADTGKRVGSEHACASSDAEGGAQATFSPDSTCFLISCSDSRDNKLVSAWNCETSEPFSVFSSRLVPPI